MSRRMKKIPIKEVQTANPSQIEKYNDLISSLDSLSTQQHKMESNNPATIPITKIVIAIVAIGIVSLGILSLGPSPFTPEGLVSKTIDSESVDFHSNFLMDQRLIYLIIKDNLFSWIFLQHGVDHVKIKLKNSKA